MTTPTLTMLAKKNTISGAKGITFGGDTFVVPETHDMVKTLFDPSVRKSICEVIILTLLASNGLVFWFVQSNSIRIGIFIGFYLFWRTSYNFGIGYLLNLQSNHHGLVKLANRFQIFKSSNTSTFSKLCQLEIKSQMGVNYSIEKYPVEFNTWLLFRKVVDLILMQDFTTFICLVIVCSIDKDYQFINTSQQSIWLVASRIVVGSFLILFNLWVKVNAHNTIKDYAWYWGDFFFRQINNEELIFDGVFEMVPHPMYSVGYVGYYGFALISKSYTVLVVALWGHFLQMIFLHYIENPHIDKIYGASDNSDLAKLNKLKDLRNFDNLKPLVGLTNFDWIRSTDLITLILAATYSIILPVFASTSTGLTLKIGKFVDIPTLSPTVMLFGLTIGIKVFEAISINTLLILQSNYKTFTKFCLSNDIPVEESLNNWSVIYNSLIVLTYSSFVGLNIFHFLIGIKIDDLYIQSWLPLRIFLGITLIATQFWINSSIIDLIGYFGWFYGDFFIPRSSSPQRSHLTKAGIYRYLNNPEQIFGVCGVMGITLIVPSLENFLCCFLWVTNNFFRINFIEKYHMIKVYGEQEVLKDSGVTKTFKKHLIPQAILRRMSDGSEIVGGGRRRSSIFSGATDSLETFIKELRNSNAKLNNDKILELSQNLYFENSDYKIAVTNLLSNEGNAFMRVELGTPLVVEWTAPNISSSRDWIGLYRISQTSYSRNKTLISSSGRWFWAPGETGKVTFAYEKLFWEEGVYEFRYHLDGKHDVAYISQPFEIKATSIDIPSQEEGIPEFANQLKERIFDKVLKQKLSSLDAPISTAVENSGDIVTTYERLSAMISLLTKVNISAKVFLHDDNDYKLDILKLSKKLIKIKTVLDELSYNDTELIIEKKSI